MRHQKKYVAILGATGMVGRRFAELLMNHPWFEIVMLIGSKSIGESYEQVWELKEAAMQAHYGEGFWQKKPFPEQLKNRYVESFDDLLNSNSVDIVFSSISAEVGHLEQQLLDRGFTDFSNSPYGRFEQENPLVIAEVNGDEITNQVFIKNPNCVTSGLGLILAPIRERYGIKEVSVVTFQSLSGRGDAKYPQDLVVSNVYPLHQSDERTEEFISREVKKIFREDLLISVSCNRVFVQEGHLVDVKMKTIEKIDSESSVAELLRSFHPLRHMDLPSGARSPLVVVNEVGRPRPVQDAFHAGGFAVAVGGLSTDDDVYDLRLQFVVNNLIRGAAGGAVLNAELHTHKQTNLQRLYSRVETKAAVFVEIG